MSDFESDPPIHLPFSHYLRDACAWINSVEWFDDDGALFTFVRAVKAHPAVKDVPLPEIHNAIVKLSAKDASIELAAWDLKSEDFEVQFQRTWERVRFPMGADPVEVACAVAGNAFLSTQTKRPARYSRFLTIAALLQLQVGCKVIYLPVRKVGGMFPCQPNTIASWIDWAIEDGVLLRTRTHSFRSEGKSRAAEYVLALHLWKSQAIGELASRLGFKVPPELITWTKDQFDASKVA